MDHSVSITWNPIRNVEFPATLQSYWIRIFICTRDLGYFHTIDIWESLVLCTTSPSLISISLFPSSKSRNKSGSTKLYTRKGGREVCSWICQFVHLLAVLLLCPTLHHIFAVCTQIFPTHLVRQSTSFLCYRPFISSRLWLCCSTSLANMHSLANNLPKIHSFPALMILPFSMDYCGLK